MASQGHDVAARGGLPPHQADESTGVRSVSRTGETPGTMAHITRGQRWLARLASAAAAAAVVAHHGVLPWLAFALLAVAPVVVIVVYAVAGLLCEVALSVVLAAAAVAARRAALRAAGRRPSPREYAVVPPQRPFVIMNPRSGGGKSRSSGCPARPPSSPPRWPCSKSGTSADLCPWNGRRGRQVDRLLRSG